MYDSQPLCLLVITETAEINTRLESSKENSNILRSGRECSRLPGMVLPKKVHQFVVS